MSEDMKNMLKQMFPGVPDDQLEGKFMTLALALTANTSIATNPSGPAGVAQGASSGSMTDLDGPPTSLVTGPNPLDEPANNPLFSINDRKNVNSINDRGVNTPTSKCDTAPSTAKLAQAPAPSPHKTGSPMDLNGQGKDHDKRKKNNRTMDTEKEDKGKERKEDKARWGILEDERKEKRKKKKKAVSGKKHNCTGDQEKDNKEEEREQRGSASDDEKEEGRKDEKKRALVKEREGKKHQMEPEDGK